MAAMDLDEEEENCMDEILPNLWVGDIHSARDTETLRQKGIFSVLTAMRGRVAVNETFTRFQVELDDVNDADALGFFPQCIAFIESELEKGRGVLVHCMAGQSRSATIVAAYLMYAKNLDVAGALELMQKARPSIYPNEGFLIQLDIFYEASYKVSKRDKVTRMYYLEKALNEIMNGDGSSELETDWFAQFPRSPSDSAPATPAGFHRRIRCKMCRQELATREHMLDHGQVGPATPASAVGLSPVTSRRPSMNQASALSPLLPMSRRPSAGNGERPSAFKSDAFGMTPISPNSRRPSMNDRTLPHTVSRRLSNPNPERPISRRPSATQSRSRLGSLAGLDTRPKQSSLLAESVRFASALSESALDDDDDDEEDDDVRAGPVTSLGLLSPVVQETIKEESARDERESNEDADGLVKGDKREGMKPSTSLHQLPSVNNVTKGGPYFSPSDLAARLDSHPKLAALKSPLGSFGGLQPMTKMNSPVTMQITSPPLLINNRCSGYFVEPMKWMEPFLESGQLAGKIICPNKKCGAKLGNFDWAGVCCSCKEWVVPGFCIHRSKVDEFV